MAYQNTTASDWRNLLDVINTFAQAQGWTEVYENISGTGQLGIEKGNCHLSIGEKPSENPIVKNDMVNGGTVDDSLLYLVVNHSLNAGTVQYWGHPSSIVTSSGDADAIYQNDLDGPFSNVWLFANATGTYIWVVTQQGGDRFNVFGFGVLDKRGMTNPDVAFCTGNYVIWWPDAADYSGNTQCEFNDPASAFNVIGLFGEPNVMCFLPDGVVDPLLGFTDGAFQTKSLKKIITRGDEAADHQSVASGEQLDYFLTVDNQLTTGGIPLSTLSARYLQNSLNVYLGDFPDIRLVNIGSLIPGQEIMFGSEVWKCFPLKRKGSRVNSNFGASPLPYTNSIEYGFAIRKIV